MEAVGEATGFASGDVSDLWPVEEIVIRARPRRSLKKLSGDEFLSRRRNYTGVLLVLANVRHTGGRNNRAEHSFKLHCSPFTMKEV